MEANNHPQPNLYEPGHFGVLMASRLPFFKDQWRKVLKDAPEFEIIGEIAKGSEALKLTQEMLPDLVLLDSEIPNGLKVCQQIHRSLPLVKVIIMTSRDDDDLIFNSIKAGAVGYLVQTQPVAEWLDLLKRIVEGEYLINEVLLARPKVAHRVLDQFRAMESQIESELQEVGVQEEKGSVYSPLTGREIEILDWVSKGTSNKQIARQLFISDQTVKNHITSILRKLNANDRTQAVIMAIQHGWVKLDSNQI